MDTVDFLNGLAAFTLSNLFAIVIVWRLACGLSTNGSCVRLLVASSLYLLLTTLLTLGLGVAGILNTWVAVALLAPPGLYCLFRAAPQADAGLALDEISDFIRSRWSSVLVPVVIGLATGWLLRHLAAGVYLTNDDRTYHAANVAQWFVDGKITLTGFTYQAYYPFNAEVFSLWYFLPFGNDALVSLTGVVYAILFFAASWSLLDVLGVSRSLRLVPIIFFLASNNIFLHSTSFSDVDLAVAVVLQAALALSIPPARARLRGFGVACLAGAMAGFAVGMKVTAGPLVLIILLGYAARIGRTNGLATAVKHAAVFTAMAVVAGGYWYLRNWLATGNPVFPAELGPFDGPFESAEQKASQLVTVLRSGLSADQAWEMFVYMASFPITHAALVLVALLWQARTWMTQRGFFRDPRSDATGLELLLVVVSLVQFPFLPFSGLNEVGGLEMTGRYLLIGYLGALMFTAPFVARFCPAPGNRWKSLLYGVGLSGLVLYPTFLHAGAVYWAPMSLAIVLSFVVLELTHWPRRVAVWIGPLIRSHATLGAALLLIGCCGWVTIRRIDQMVLRNPVLAELEKLPAGASISSYGGELFYAYSYFGRRLQFRPVRLLQDGRVCPPLHLRQPRDGSITFWDYIDRDPGADPSSAEFFENLRGEEINYLITLRNPKTGWPVQHGWLEEKRIPKSAELPEGTIWKLKEAL